MTVLRENTFSKVFGFISRQQEPFKANLVRTSIQNFFYNLTNQYQPIYMMALGANPLELGVINGIGGLAAAAVSTPIGWLVSRYGVRWMYLVGLPIMAFGAFLFAVAPNWVWLIPAIFVSSLSFRWMVTSCSMVCGSYLKNEERATGMQLCDTISSIPRIASPLIAAVVITIFGGLNEKGIRPLYGLQIIGIAFIFIFVLLKFEDPLMHGRAYSGGFFESLRIALSKSNRVKAWILFTTLSTLSMFMSSTYLSVYAADIKNADQYLLGGMATAAVVLPLLLSLPIGRLADTFGRKKIILLLIPLYCLSFVTLLLAQDPLMVIVSGIFQGFSMLIFITENAIAAELVPLESLGNWLGFLGFFRGLASVGGPVLGGIIWSVFGPSTVLFSLIILELSKLLVLQIGIPETLQKH
ncbi:MFS transporter [Candidatus Bathyarchaeota archaeon]|nr:MFS transporter [Candidatus Bathyarchaeota archaeon]